MIKTNYSYLSLWLICYLFKHIADSTTACFIQWNVIELFIDYAYLSTHDLIEVYFAHTALLLNMFNSERNHQKTSWSQKYSSKVSAISSLTTFHFKLKILYWNRFHIWI